MRVKGASPWMSAVEMVSIIKSGDRKLACVITHAGEKWSANAIETGADVDTTVGLFADHGHKHLGVFSSPVRAIAACEDFARKWVKERDISQCGCAEIPTGEG